jgi:hypothetical protein
MTKKIIITTLILFFNNLNSETFLLKIDESHTKNYLKKEVSYNELGYNESGIHKDTGTKYDLEGYDENGFDVNGIGIIKCFLNEESNHFQTGYEPVSSTPHYYYKAIFSTTIRGDNLSGTLSARNPSYYLSNSYIYRNDSKYPDTRHSNVYILEPKTGSVNDTISNYIFYTQKNKSYWYSWKDPNNSSRTLYKYNLCIEKIK